MESYLDNLLVPVYEGYKLIREIFEVHGMKFLKNLNNTPAELMENHLGIHYVYYTRESCNSTLAEVMPSLSSYVGGFVF